MKKLLLPALLSLLSFSFQAQVILDTLGDLQKDVDLVHSAHSVNGQEFYTIVRSSYLPYYRILRFDNNLQIIDTIPYSSYRQNHPVVSRLFNFKNKPYALLGNSIHSNRRMNLQLLEQNNLTDSFYISADTLQYYAVYDIYEENENTLRLFVNSYDPNYSYSKGTYIYDLDSNFQIKNIHRIYPNRSIHSSTIIQSVSEVNDSLWHVHFNNEVYGYNPQTKKQLFGKYLEGNIYSYFTLNDSTYLGFGIPSILGIPPLQATKEDALGFYTIDQWGNAIDTTAFNTFSHFTPATNSMEYSNEKSDFRNSLFYDTGNIIMASAYSYYPAGLQAQHEGFFILKTDIHGNEKWRFSIGNPIKITNLTSILKTPEQGCILTGSFAPNPNDPWHNNSILIKLGPDGTISNIELDAPETVINFYPNPVKDKLYYNYLPEANGNYTLEIIDMQGKPVQDVVLENAKGFIPVSLQSGFYLYHLKSDNGKVEQVGRLVVE